MDRTLKIVKRYHQSPLLSTQMLQHTFLHLPHVSSRKEKDLWQRGIFTWDDYSKTTCRQLSLFEEFPRKDALAESRKALKAEDLAFFARSLHPHEYYRLAASFPEDVMFLVAEEFVYSVHSCICFYGYLNRFMNS